MGWSQRSETRAANGHIPNRPISKFFKIQFSFQDFLETKIKIIFQDFGTESWKWILKKNQDHFSRFLPKYVWTKSLILPSTYTGARSAPLYLDCKINDVVQTYFGKNLEKWSWFVFKIHFQDYVAKLLKWFWCCSHDNLEMRTRSWKNSRSDC